RGGRPPGDHVKPSWRRGDGSMDEARSLVARRRLPLSWVGDRESLRAGSLSYIRAGEEMRAAIGRAIDAGLTKREWKAFVFILSRTAAYSKLADAVFVDEIADELGLDRTDPKRTHTKQALRNVRRKGVSGYFPARRHAEISVVSLSPDVSARPDTAPL